IERYYNGTPTEAALRMAEVPEGAELVAGSLRFPTVLARNVYVLPGVPEIFRQKFDALRERFRDRPFRLKCVSVRIGERTLAAHLFTALGASTFSDPRDGFHSEVAREMLARGDFVTPRLDGVRYFDKPPLVCWLISLSSLRAGPTPVAARFWSALAAVGVAG